MGNLEVVPLRGRKATSGDLSNQHTLLMSLLCIVCSITCRGHTAPVGLEHRGLGSDRPGLKSGLALYYLVTLGVT